MSRQSHLLHFHISKQRRINWLDKTAVIAAFLYPLSGTPQAIEVLKGHVEGVSVASWLGFMVFSAFFLAYALVHKIKPMIITSALWLMIDGCVVVGAIVYKVTA